MGRTSGPFPLGTANTFGPLQVFTNGLTANGIVAANGGLRALPVIQTGAFTAVPGVYSYLCDTTGGAFTMTLEAAPTSGIFHLVKLISPGVNNLTISGNGHNIDGAATLVMATQYEAALLQWNAANAAWYVMAANAGAII